jgi:hypothetical protein
MRTRTLTVAAVAGAVVASVLTPVPAFASDEGAINGTFTATSNGEWAMNNEVFHDEKSVRAIWTISTTCSYPTECTGTVVSDQGWTAPIYQKGGMWYVKHTVPDWMPCEDGSTSPGLQVFRFIPITPDGASSDPTSNTLAGEDQTTGVSGACGKNLPLFINIPFKLVKQE